ncbi:hypothetical protein [Streptomyces triticirhizae]|uniref:DUF3558 domain-containing protein n=1 Tax=Streptomyces triticirhizae TaxID=2483353 RepID=A0A3M2LAL9_9ACTN|nr:hypothetical protein [Streptomyces triticirhizae]RMI33750.1 hypothetical protein EBN88_24420 [Streptomyces triticirhizae]
MRRRTGTRGAAWALGAAVGASLLAGCGAAEEGAPAANTGAPATGWDEPADYTYTWASYEGPCGGESAGSWTITVEDGETVANEPLDEVARGMSWDEGAPTIAEEHAAALGVREDGAYDRVDIAYVESGPDEGRPASVHFLDRPGEGDDPSYEGQDSCVEFTDFAPAD